VTNTLVLGGYWINSHNWPHLSHTYIESGPMSVSHSPMSCLCPLTSTGVSISIDYHR
jgi:hypothetical protein